MGMTIGELINALKKFPQHLPVAYRCCSEQCELEEGELKVASCCLPRDDGWIQDARPDMPSQEYLMFPGN